MRYSISIVAVALAAVTASTVPPGIAGAQERPSDEGVIRLPDVVISGTRLPDPLLLDLSRIPGQVYRVTEEDVARSGARSVPDLLQYKPGITLYQAVGNAFEPQLDLRGFSGEPVTTTTVTLDGVRVNTPDFNVVNWDLVPTEDLQRVEAIPGTATVFGKNSLGGVVNLQTKRGGPVPEASLEVAGGSFSHTRYRGSLSGPAAGFDYHVGFTQYLEEGFRDQSDADVRRLFTKIGRRIGTDTDITLSYLFGESRLEQAGSLPEALLRRDRTLNFTPGDFAARLLHAGTLNVRQTLPLGFSATLNAFLRELDADSFIAGLGSTSRTDNDTFEWGGTLQLAHQSSPFGHRNVFVTGVEHTRSDIGTRSVVDFGFGPALTKSFIDDSVWGLFVQDSFDVVPDILVVSGGGRWDRDRVDFRDRTTPALDQTRTFRRFNPRAGVNVNPAKDVGFYGSYSEGFRTPTAFELFAFAPFSSNPDLAAPKSKTYEVGSRARFGQAVDGTLALFQTDVEDEIFFIPTGLFTGLNQNAVKTRRRGVEAGLTARYAKLVDGFVNYSYIVPTFEADVLLASGQVRAGNEIPLVPRQRLGAGVNVRPVRDLLLSLGGLFVGERRLSGDEPNTVKSLDDYVVLNGRISYRWGPVTAFLQGENLLDAKYEPWGVFAAGTRFLIPAPGVSVLAGVSLGFSGFYK